MCRCRQAKKLNEMLKAYQQENTNFKHRLNMPQGGPARSMSPLGPSMASNRAPQMVGAGLSVRVLADRS